MPVLQHAGEQIVAVREGIDADGHTIPDDPFDRKASGIEFRPQPLNDDALKAADRARR
jgi:hypothetical protein